LRYAVHDTLVTAAFSALFLLKMANLFPSELDLGAIVAQVEQLEQLFSDVAAERYALTLRIMLANFRRKVGMFKGSPSPLSSMTSTSMQDVPQTFMDNTRSQDITGYNSATIPAWLQEQSLTDLGLPPNGHDGILLRAREDSATLPEAW
jgi:hypothetical protein